LLERQWAGPYPRLLQVSSGLSYAWDPSRKVGQRVARDSVTLQGKPLDPLAQYRIPVNSFIASGGDDFSVLRRGRDRVEGEFSRDAIVQYLEAHSPLAPGKERRVTNLAQGS